MGLQRRRGGGSRHRAVELGCLTWTVLCGGTAPEQPGRPLWAPVRRGPGLLWAPVCRPEEARLWEFPWQGVVLGVLVSAVKGAIWRGWGVGA